MRGTPGGNGFGARAPFAAAVMGHDAAAIRDDEGHHAMPALRAVAADWAEILIGHGLKLTEPVIVPVSGRASDVAAMMAVVAAGGVAVPLHRRAHPDTLTHAWAATGARFGLDALEDGTALVDRRGKPPPPRPLLNGAAFITFTSGSTGRPKGVVLSGARMLGKLRALAEALRFPAGGSAMVPLQLTFSFGQWVTFLTLMQGGTVHLTERFDPGTVQDRLTHDVIGHLAAVPTMLRMIPPEPGPSVRILTGGEAVRPDLRRRLLDSWPAAEIFSIYGLTESGTSDLILHDVAAAKVADSLGVPSPGVDTRLDPDSGELLLRTPYGMLGYLDMPDETTAAYADGWLRTGDVARRTADGRLVLSGRLKEIINRAGNKVSPLEVEGLFAGHPAVEAVLATGVADARLGEAIHLLVVPRTGTAPPSPEDLRAWASGRIDRFKLPDHIHLAAALPLGRTGKADRSALRRRLETGDRP